MSSVAKYIFSCPRHCDQGLIVIVYYFQIWNKRTQDISSLISSYIGPMYIETHCIIQSIHWFFYTCIYTLCILIRKANFYLSSKVEVWNFSCSFGKAVEDHSWLSRGWIFLTIDVDLMDRTKFMTFKIFSSCLFKEWKITTPKWCLLFLWGLALKQTPYKCILKKDMQQ